MQCPKCKKETDKTDKFSISASGSVSYNAELTLEECKNLDEEQLKKEVTNMEYTSLYVLCPHCEENIFNFSHPAVFAEAMKFVDKGVYIKNDKALKEHYKKIGKKYPF